MKVIVCGGRAFTDYELLEKTLDRLHAEHKFSVVIHGCARGADTFADNWAYSRHVDVDRCPAMWTKYGKAAGPTRNREMLAKSPQLVIAFGGQTGTDHMVQIAKEAGVLVIEVERHHRQQHRLD